MSNPTPLRRGLRLAAASLALAAASASASAVAADAAPASRGRALANIGTPPAAATPQPSTGNWMREYVQLRVAERNLRTGAAVPAQDGSGGVSQPNIVGGSVAGASDNPFQVGLVTKSIANDFDAQYCGGTLIKPNVVVTAAHCSDFVTASQVQILAGSRNLDGTGTRYNVSRISIPSRWNENTYDYDVAVWILSTPATGIPLATLASADPVVGTDLLVTGWGTIDNGSYPTTLRKATVPLVSRTNCNDANSYQGDITQRMVCAGLDAGGIDSCQGDSGGPIALGNVLVGIVSWGDGCALPNKPGVYTRVSNLSIRTFIENAAAR